MEIYLKLEDEFQELQQKMGRLKTFIDSDKYQTLSDESQSLLFIQYESMRTYGSCLVSRMKLIMREGINGTNK
jgi:hypothetical protein